MQLAANMRTAPKHAVVNAIDQVIKVRKRPAVGAEAHMVTKHPRRARWIVATQGTASAHVGYVGSSRMFCGAFRTRNIGLLGWYCA